MASKRTLELTLEGKTGSFQRFYAFVDGKRVIAEDGNMKGTWKGDVGEKATIKIRVMGIADASFQLTIDLPGTANDQKLTFSLTGGYYECEISI